jgi:hypothetical protein
MIPEDIWKAINSDSELIFEHSNNHWKALDEHKMMEVLGRGFEMVEKKRKNYTPSLKRIPKGLGV